MAKGRFPMGGLPGGNMNNMIKQAQKMQENLIKAQQEIEEATYDISTGGGAVNLTINGNNQITKSCTCKAPENYAINILSEPCIERTSQTQHHPK